VNSDILFVVEHLRGNVLEISYVMAAAARRLSQVTHGNCIAVLLGHESLDLAKDLAADRVLYVDHPALADFTPDVYLDVLTPVLKEAAPRAVLLGHTSIGMDVASGLSARLGWPIVSQCKSMAEADGELKFTSQIYAGRVLIEGDLPGPTALVTLIPGGYKAEDGHSEQAPSAVQVTGSLPGESRIKLSQYLEPDVTDVDITKEAILVAVGRGLQNQEDLGQIEELAAALNGAVCASRPLIDLGWLPSTRLVGKSGHSVHPNLYLAMGISGSTEHVEGMANSETIIAINTDPNAPIFNIAQYGAVVDMLDFVKELLSNVEQIKVG
jgi:electron transfer flavoprotein alpha subunit